MNTPNPYSGAQLDRADHLREDPQWLDRCLQAPETRILPYDDGKSLFDAEGQPVAFGPAELRRQIDDAPAVVFLGLVDGVAYWALELCDPQPLQDGHSRFANLRAFGTLLDRRSAALLAYGRAMLYWHQRQRHCGVCGAATRSVRAGHVRRCTDESCATDHFPRTDPAVIMLVHDGEGHCVLGRRPGWPSGIHSTLAGFVEPGESLEEAVAREVNEEAGLEVDPSTVRYHSSQPWPFPASLMLGFHVRAERRPLTIDRRELEHAAWFSRTEVLQADAGSKLRLPPHDSIARRLIDDWSSSGAGRR